MRRWLPVLLPVLFLQIACIAATPPPLTEITAAQSPSAAFETDSVMSTAGKPTGDTGTPPAAKVNVSVYFTHSGDADMIPVPVARVVPGSDNLAAVVQSTLGELLRGPTDAEKAQGLISWFSPATAHALTSATINEGQLAVDFSGLDTIIPNASTSAGSQMLLSQLNSTVFQFPAIQNIRYSLDGECAAFWEWLQYDCRTVTRAEWESG
jgi:hypothetical protein